jgi:hypothetical protein
MIDSMGRGKAVTLARTGSKLKRYADHHTYMTDMHSLHSPMISITYQSYMYDAELLETRIDEGKYLIPDEENGFVQLELVYLWEAFFLFGRWKGFNAKLARMSMHLSSRIEMAATELTPSNCE